MLARLLQALLDVTLEMRQLFNDQQFSHTDDVSPWVPALSIHSTENLARLVLCRQLEGRLVPFEDELAIGTFARTLATTQDWSSTYLEGAIEEVKALLRSVVRE
ncbi:hypothetical protein [Acidithrix ferrooxidans]|uniref:Uncharacterized protein n=1 Tax=Acidithrix ferrooxidans TaxID=1280514 RepID=A0A0D8HJY2_9ACTN|nr:hypothetical protein [Acidithrix ferrooxidans]KJF18057.1 hypothetical protein AXFE_11560 [Acidithrix ferrooxidans]